MREREEEVAWTLDPAPSPYPAMPPSKPPHQPQALAASRGTGCLRNQERGAQRGLSALDPRPCTLPLPCKPSPPTSGPSSISGYRSPRKPWEAHSAVNFDTKSVQIEETVSRSQAV
jgi:hypothetical protein